MLRRSDSGHPASVLSSDSRRGYSGQLTHAGRQGAFEQAAGSQPARRPGSSESPPPGSRTGALSEVRLQSHNTLRALSPAGTGSPAICVRGTEREERLSLDRDEDRQEDCPPSGGGGGGRRRRRP
ncbi:unnamed protein product [Merluccius merluccius]